MLRDKNYRDYQLHFDKRVAKEYGLPEAVVINVLQNWIATNKAKGENYRMGRTWTFNTYEEWAADKYFMCFSKEQMRRIFDSLIGVGVLIKNNFNKKPGDKTNWYAFKDEEQWVEAKSPIANYGSDRPDGLPESAEQKENSGTLFEVETLPESANAGDENALLKSTVSNLSENPLPESAEPKERSAEIGNGTAGIDSPISRNRQTELPESAEHYQLNNNSFHSFTEEEVNGGGNMKDIMKILTTIVDLEVIECVQRNYHDALKFDFNDTELLDKHVHRLFRMFVGMDLDKMNDANIMRVKKELIDTRPGLTRAVCWIIILRAFTDYPSWAKDFKNIKSLLGRIDKQKQKYLDDLDREVKKADLQQARIDRKDEFKSQVESAKKLQTETAQRIQKLLDEHKDILPFKIINKINITMKSSMILAEGELIDYLETKGVVFEG